MKRRFAAEKVSELKTIRLLPEDHFLQRTADIHKLIARRAYELFLESGFMDGHDLEHWLQAESQLLTPARVEVLESQDAIKVKTTLAGFDAESIEIHVQPQRVFISGQQVERSEASAGREERMKRIFRRIDLPSQIDVSGAKATFSKGEFEIILSRVKASPKAVAATNNG
jgi:HSP20 family molecular chaperone IbpA